MSTETNEAARTANVALARYANQVASVADVAREQTLRPALQQLLEDYRNVPGLSLRCLNEGRAKDLEGVGIPDFLVYSDADTLFNRRVGLIECKRLGTPLDPLVESEQIKRYAEACPNILLTDYRRFLLIHGNEVCSDVTVLDEHNNALKPNVEVAFNSLLMDFSGYEYASISSKASLVDTLANVAYAFAKDLTSYLLDDTNKEEPWYIKFHALKESFKTSVQMIYSIVDFCDIYAQSLVYGLLMARLDGARLNEKDISGYLNTLPKNFNLLYEFLNQAYDRTIPDRLCLTLSRIARHLNLIDAAAIRKEFQESRSRNSIAVYLYEDFLRHYDYLAKSDQRDRNGVYYTPHQVADFIVRAVDDLSREAFELKDGIAAEEMKVLDFACGTGTFLKATLERMLPKHHLTSVEVARWREKILRDLYGFELLFTPYVIAHTLLGQTLQEHGIILQPRDHLKVFLTNTLDLARNVIPPSLPNLQREGEGAYLAKTATSILSIIGNPPYFNGDSQENKCEFIDRLLADYKPKGERKTNLTDLYVKFFRFADWKIATQGRGILGLITNNKYLYGPTFRQMRAHLMETFDDLYILNLHGNALIGEKDTNIFTIRVGVAIVLFVRHATRPAQKRIRYASIVEQGCVTAAEKLAYLEKHSLGDIPWKDLPAEAPMHLFVDYDATNDSRYAQFWPIKDIFDHFNSGIQTKKDDFCIHATLKSLEKLRLDSESLSLTELRQKYAVEDGKAWRLADAQSSLITDYNPSPIKYRPFDFRWTSLCTQSSAFLGRPRYDTMQHLRDGNLGLCFPRQAHEWHGALVTDTPIDLHYLCDQTYVAPLYLFGIDEGRKDVNWSPRFRKEWLETLDFTSTPEEVFACIYAILWSPTYAERYKEQLRFDFPRIPLPREEATFRAYAEIGTRLIDLHLLRKRLDSPDIHVKGEIPRESFTIGKVQYYKGDVLKLPVSNGPVLEINNLPLELWEFTIGAFAPLQQWLKLRARDKIPLTFTDLDTLEQMARTIAHTLTLQKELSELPLA